MQCLSSAGSWCNTQLSQMKIDYASVEIELTVQL